MKQIKFVNKILVYTVVLAAASFLLEPLVQIRQVKAQAERQSDFIAEAKVEGLVEEKDIVAGEVLVKYEGEKDYELVRIDGGKITTDLNQADSDTEQEEIKDKLKELIKDGNVESAQPNYIYTATWTDSGSVTKPDDYSDSRHWYYTKAEVPEMWDSQSCASGGLSCGGDSDVIVAVIDTGLAFEDFDDTGGISDANYVGSAEYSGLNFFVNSDEIAGNGLDDDCNGYVDDVNGIDSYGSTIVGTNTCTGITPNVVSSNFEKVGHPVDTYGHGSHVTGTIASATNNNTGSVSPAFEVSIMPLAANVYFGRSFTSLSLVRAVEYAEDNGADIINMSLGGKGNDSAFQSALNSAYDSGVVLIAASGNTCTCDPGPSDDILETTVVYPGAYTNVISVGALNSNDSKTSYSVYGNGVDLVAYVGSGATAGNAVWQTTLSCYGGCDKDDVDSGTTERYSIGTSFAAPQVAGLAALIKSKYPSLNKVQIKNQLINSARDVAAGGYDIQTGWGVVDFYTATNVLDTSTPENVLPRSVYRFLNKDVKIHFYTANEGEKAYVLNNLSSAWDYEGEVFRSYTTDAADTQAVYRFLHRNLKIHFYTANDGERNYVLNNLSSDWQYEGVAFYTYVGTDSRQLHRYLNYNLKVHFYTASTWEKNFLDTELNNDWKYEGIAYNVK